MATRTLGIIMNGVTGRMGLNQHLVRSILAIREQGGVALPNGDRVMPDPILVGRNAEKIAALAKQHGVARHTTDLNAALKNPNDTVFFDAAKKPIADQDVDFELEDPENHTFLTAKGTTNAFGIANVDWDLPDSLPPTPPWLPSTTLPWPSAVAFV